MIFCSIATVILIFIGVVMRYVLNMNFYGSEEIIIIVAFWLYFLGAAHGSYEKSHIKADLVSIYVTHARIRDGITLVAQLVTVFVCLVFTKWGLDYLIWDIRMMPLSTALKIPLVIPQSAIFVGYVLMTFYHTYYMARDLRAYFGRGENPDPDVPATEEGL